MMKQKGLKVILNILEVFLAIILISATTILVIRQGVVNISSRQKVKNLINDIDVFKYLKDKNGQDIASLKTMKEALIKSGMPKEAITYFLNSIPIKKLYTDVVKELIDDLIANKKIQLKEYREEEIYLILKENMANIVKDMQKDKVPASKLLTNAKQQEILNNIKPHLKIITKELNLMRGRYETNVKKMQLGNNKEMNKILKLVSLGKKIFTKKAAYLLISLIIISLISLILIKWSNFIFLKHLAIISIIISIIFLLEIIPIVMMKKFLGFIPLSFHPLILYIGKSFIKSFIIIASIMLVIGVFLIITKKLLSKKELRKN